MGKVGGGGEGAWEDRSLLVCGKVREWGEKKVKVLDQGKA